MANCVDCGSSNMGIGRVPLTLVDGKWYCTVCLKKANLTVECSDCGNQPFISEEHFKTIDGKMLCTKCMEKKGIMKKYEYIMETVTARRAAQATGTTASPASSPSSAPGGNQSANISSLGGMGKVLTENLSPGETVKLAIQGNAGEALACSDNHIFILKVGMAAGSLVGKKCVKFKWQDVDDVEVKAGSLYGFVEIRSRGMPTFDAKDISKAKQSDNAVTFLVQKRGDFDQAMTSIRSYLGR